MDKFIIVKRPQVQDPAATPSTSAEATGAGPEAASSAAPAPRAMEKRKREKSRKYSEMYLKFGFSSNGVELPVCVVCAATLSNESMKPSKLQRHFETNHAHLQGKESGYHSFFPFSIANQIMKN